MSYWKDMASVYARDKIEGKEHEILLTPQQCREELIRQGAFGRSLDFLEPDEVEQAPPEMTPKEVLDVHLKMRYGIDAVKPPAKTVEETIQETVEEDENPFKGLYEPKRPKGKF